MIPTNNLYGKQINEVLESIDHTMINLDRTIASLPSIPKPIKNVVNTAFKATYPNELDPKYFPPSPPLTFKNVVIEILLSPLTISFGLIKLSLKITVFVLSYIIPFRLLILPATYIFNETTNVPEWRSLFLGALATKQSFFQEHSNRAIEVNLTSPDGVEINTCMIWNKESDRARFHDSHEDISLENTKWIYLSGANATSYEQNFYYANWLSNTLGVNVLLWNPRGVMQSGNKTQYDGTVKTEQLKSANEIVVDAVTAYQYLKSKGVKDEDIDMPTSHSLGGAINTQVRAIYHGPICNDRSFSSLENLVAAQIAKFSRPLAYLIGTLVGLVLREANWELDSLTAWQKNKSPFKRIISGKNDTLICGIGQLYTAVKRNDPNYKKVKNKTSTTSDPNAGVKSKIQHMKTDMEHNDPWSRDIYEKALGHTKKALRL